MLFRSANYQEFFFQAEIACFTGAVVGRAR